MLQITNYQPFNLYPSKNIKYTIDLDIIHYVPIIQTPIVLTNVIQIVIFFSIVNKIQFNHVFEFN